MKVELAAPQTVRRVPFGLPGAAVPDHYGAATILAWRDDAFKVRVVQWMVFDLDGQRFGLGIGGRAFGNGPTLQHAAQFEAEVVMQVAGGVLLHDKQPLASRALGRALGLRRL